MVTGSSGATGTIGLRLPRSEAAQGGVWALVRDGEVLLRVRVPRGTPPGAVIVGRDRAGQVVVVQVMHHIACAASGQVRPVRALETPEARRTGAGRWVREQDPSVAPGSHCNAPISEEAHDALRTLLGSLFNQDELRVFLAGIPGGEKVNVSVGHANAGMSIYADAVTSALARQGMLDTLFDQLVERTPRRRADIERVRDILASSGPWP